VQGRIQREDVEITLSISPSEARDLYEELHTWTPNHGWSREAEHFFELLKDAGGLK
jgi:hypothetical protein